MPTDQGTDSCMCPKPCSHKTLSSLDFPVPRLVPDSFRTCTCSNTQASCTMTHCLIAPFRLPSCRSIQCKNTWLECFRALECKETNLQNANPAHGLPWRIPVNLTRNNLRKPTLTPDDPVTPSRANARCEHMPTLNSSALHYHHHPQHPSPRSS